MKKDDKLFIRIPMTISATVSQDASTKKIEKALLQNAAAQIHEYLFVDRTRPTDLSPWPPQPPNRR